MNNKIKPYIKSYLNFLKRKKLYTFINLVGLSLSLTVVVFLASLTIKGLSFDRFHDDCDNLYILSSERETNLAHGLGNLLKSRYPWIEAVSETSSLWDTEVYYNSESTIASVFAADSNFFKLLSFELIEGDKERVLNVAQDCAVSESFAHEFLGEAPYVGRRIIIDETSVVVNGVYKDFTNSSFRNHDIIIELSCLNNFNAGTLREGYNSSGNITTILKIEPDTDFSVYHQEILGLFQEVFMLYNNSFFGIREKVEFIPIKNLYFSDREVADNIIDGNYTYSLILTVAGLILLVMSVFNYINLTVAQSGFRMKEFATHRLLGASQRTAFIRMVLESILFCAITFILAFLLAELFAPFLNKLLGVNAGVFETLTVKWVLVYVAFILFTGVISGVFPAILMLRYKPIDIVRGEFSLKTNKVFSRVFIFIQAFVSIALVSSALIIYFQIGLMTSSDMGFNTKNIAIITTSKLDAAKCERLYQELTALPYVKRVGRSNGSPVSKGLSFRQINENSGEESVGTREFRLDSTSFKIFGLEMVRGEWVTMQSGVLINQTWENLLEDKNTTGIKLSGHAETFQLVGIVKDFHCGSYTNQMLPAIIHVGPVKGRPDLIVEFYDGKAQEERCREIREIIAGMTPYSTDLTMVEDKIRSYHGEEISALNSIVVFSLVSILITFLGLLAVSIYYIQQCSKEIAIKKIVGSDTSAVMASLVIRFMKSVFVAFVLVTPIVWYCAVIWLSDFLYNIRGFLPLIFAFSLLIILLIAVGSVFFQSLKAARQNPVEGLRR